MSAAMRSRWTNVFAHGLTEADVVQVMKAKYGGKIPDVELAKLTKTHVALAAAADEGEIGHKTGGIAFTLRDLNRVSDRFLRYQGQGLADEAVMRREMEEVYLGGLTDAEDVAKVKTILDVAMPYTGPGFYENLTLKEEKDSFTIGDVVVRKLNTGDGRVPSEASRLVMTERTKQILYRLSKALDMGENVALIGERASGKTAVAKMYAMLRGQPYYRQLFSGATDGMQLIGGYDDRGWHDGLLLDAGRPSKKPGLFLGDELNLANPALLERLNPVLDDERKLVLAEKDGEEVKLDREFRFVAAMNPPTKEYGGRQKLSKALQNRFTTIWVPNLEKREEMLEIAKTRAVQMKVPEVVVEKLVELHEWVKEGYAKDTLGKGMREMDKPIYSVRQLMKALEMVQELQGDMGAGKAFLIAIEANYAASAELADTQAIMAKAESLAK